MDDLLEGAALLLIAEDLQALDERQAGVEHDRELAGEDRHPLRADAARQARQELDLAPLLADRLVTWMCCRRSTATAASRESASSWPSWSVPVLVRPFHTKLGIPQLLATSAGEQRRVQRLRTAVDDLLQLVRVGRARERRLQGDHALEVERRQRLVERLHAVLGLAGLHHAVDLVHLVLADQVADRRVGDQDLHRHAPAPCRRPSAAATGRGSPRARTRAAPGSAPAGGPGRCR